MKAPLAYLSLAAACAVLAVRFGGLVWLLLWPAAAFAYVAALYPLNAPGGWGKRDDGSFHPPSRVLLAPVGWTLLALWHATRRSGRRPAMNEVHPNLWLSRRPLVAELPPTVGLVIDLTSELSPARGVIFDGRGYVAVPTLDYAPPPVAAARAALDRAQRHLAQISDRPAVLIHCAGGIGRSTTLMAALLTRLGVAPDIAAAVEHIRRTRPAVRLTPAQQDRAAELAATWPDRES